MPLLTDSLETIVEITNACPKCDAPLDYGTARSRRGIPIWQGWRCPNCNAMWIKDRENPFT